MKILVATLALTLSSLVVTAQKKLVADVYPGAVMMSTAEENLILTRNSGYSTANAEAYLVKDEKSKVIAFYQKKHKKAKHLLPCENGDQYLEMQAQQTDEYGLMSAGIIVSSNPYKKTSQEDISGFDELRSLVKQQLHTEEEFNKIYERYKYLNYTFFNNTSEEDTLAGGLLNFQEQLYNTYTAKVKPVDMAAQMEGMVVRIGQLTDEGKYEEAHDLTGKLRDLLDKGESVKQADAWTTWLEYLSILEKNAYKSMIMIHKPIAQWHTDQQAVVSQK